MVPGGVVGGGSVGVVGIDVVWSMLGSEVKEVAVVVVVLRPV